jgi:Phage integrase, N-terminal SAM-like domain
MGKGKSGQLTFGRYVADTWLPNHVIEATTRESYTSVIGKHIIPWFGDMALADVRPADVRRWVTHLSGSGAGMAVLRWARRRSPG